VSVERPVISPISVGSVPVKKFCCPAKAARPTNVPRVVGIGPSIKLLLKFKAFNVVMLAICGGSVPPMLFSANMSVSALSKGEA
jgi:hypothetical protein